jgi:hypothetical protein
MARGGDGRQIRLAGGGGLWGTWSGSMSAKRGTSSVVANGSSPEEGCPRRLTLAEGDHW